MIQLQIQEIIVRRLLSPLRVLMLHHLHVPLFKNPSVVVIAVVLDRVVKF